MTTDDLTLDRVCGNCHSVHPAEPWQSDFAICLSDPDLEPYLDDIMDRQDFSRCQDLVLRKRFAWDREACDKFDPVDDIDEGEEIPPELAEKLIQLARDGELSAETLKMTTLEDAVARIDWAHKPVDDYLRKIQEAKSFEARRKAVGRFGHLICEGNRAAFDGLCHYLRDLPPPESVPDKELRIEVLRQLRLVREPDWVDELARVLVDDLFRTPSNNTTRGWYTAVFNYFERSCPEHIAEDVLDRILDSPRFSYRIKKRVRGILGQDSDDGYWL